MLRTLGIVIVAALEIINAAPTAGSDDSVIKPPIFFENGKIGVNFLGFHASAGLGGILTGNNADGGLQAEAGTPFGQRAWAGLGGGLSGAGRSSGGLYAGATAGGGVGAKAGIGGRTESEGSYGTSYAGASAGGLYKGRVKNVGPPTVNLSVQKELVTSLDTSNIQVLTKEDKIEKVDKYVIAPTVQEIVPPQPVFNLDVRAQGFAALPPPPPPSPIPQFPVYVEKRKYKLRRRPHRKQVIITNEFIPPQPEAPILRYNEDYVGHVGGPATFIVQKKIVTDGYNVPFPTVNAAEQSVGHFAQRIEEPSIKPVEIKEKSITVQAEASKPFSLFNFEASKQVSVNI